MIFKRRHKAKSQNEPSVATIDEIKELFYKHLAINKQWQEQVIQEFSGFKNNLLDQQCSQEKIIQEFSGLKNNLNDHLFWCQNHVAQKFSELHNILGNQQSWLEQITEDLAQVKDASRKLGRSQYQANTVAKAERQEFEQMLQQILSLVAQPQKETLHEILTVVDGLEQGLQAIAKVEDEILKAWGSGFAIVHERLIRILEKWYVKPIESVGAMFTPHHHRAVAVYHSDELEENIVVEEQLRGYLWGNDVLRYAEVVVSKKEIDSESNSGN